MMMCVTVRSKNKGMNNGRMISAVKTSRDYCMYVLEYMCKLNECREKCHADLNNWNLENGTLYIEIKSDGQNKILNLILNYND